jgi:hypothetical protein
MKMKTNLGMFGINPEFVVSIQPAPILPDNIDFADLTYCVDFDDRFYDMAGNIVCISEDDAQKLSELSGIEITKRKNNKTPDYPKHLNENRPKISIEKVNRKNIFVPFQKQIILNGWEKFFDETIAWKDGFFREQKREPQSAPASM